MTIEQPLSDTDITRAAALHMESIDDSLPALLGHGFARRLYRYLDASESERVLVERIDGQIESVCVVSFKPKSLQRRVVRATLVPLIGYAVWPLLASPPFRALLWNVAHDAMRSAEDHAKAPEITYVFTNAQFRGRRLGERLIKRVDAELRELGINRYFVKTLDDPSNQAIRFYDENGFDRIGSRVEGGRAFVEFHKNLAPR